MIERAFAERFRRLLRQFPVVTLVGPRQCGKTTFVKSFLPTWRYLDFEKSSDLSLFADDPESALYQQRERFVIDEAHRLPALFPLLRGWIDARRQKKGRAVLLGSVSPTLVKAISESLAGRTGFLEMTPLQWGEVTEKGVGTRSLLWLRGGFPEAYLARSASERFDWYDAYVKTFIERDLLSLGIDVSPSTMRKVWAMLANGHGGLWNASEMASSLGINYHTVNRYTDILEQAFLIRKLPPYFANIGKRVVKRPKLYLRDPGLLHYFFHVRQFQDLDVHPRRGASWEGFVIEQILGLLARTAPSIRPFFWRTGGGEVDVLLETARGLVPIEIKLHSAPNRSSLKGLAGCMKDLRLAKGFVIYPGERAYSLGNGIQVVPFRQMMDDPTLLVGNLRHA